MAEKVLKNRTQFTTTLKNELYSLLDQLSKETDIPKTKLLDKAVELLLEKYNIDVIVDLKFNAK